MLEDPKLRVLIADDHAAMRLGIAAVVQSLPGGVCVGEAPGGEEAVRLYERLRPDLLTLDLRMPGLDGLLVIQRVLAIDPGARILVLTMYDLEDDVVRSLKSGARGYVLKSAPTEELAEAMSAVARGMRYTPAYIAQRLASGLTAPALTPRELEVLALIHRGASNKEIGRQLGLTEGTVKSHVYMIMGKLNAQSRTEAAGLALQRGLLKGDPMPGLRADTL